MHFKKQGFDVFAFYVCVNYYMLDSVSCIHSCHILDLFILNIFASRTTAVNQIINYIFVPTIHFMPKIIRILSKDHVP